MKILITSDWYIPAVNGVVTSVLNLRKGLEERGHEVRILTLSQTPYSFSEDGVTYIGSLPAGIVYPGARLRTALGFRQIRELIKWKPDVVHSNCEFSTFGLAKKISKYLDIPLIHTYHTVYESYTHYFSPSRKWGRSMVKNFSGRIALCTDCLIAPTEKVKTLLEGYDIQKPIYVIPTGIEQERFSGSGESVDKAPERKINKYEIRRKFDVPDAHTLLISVGRLAKEKNCEELIQAFSNFRNKPISLLFVGDGPCREELEYQVNILGMDRQIKFAGMIPREDIHHYYNAGDLFVSASTSETQGLTFLEALTSGLPMLCRKDDCLKGILTDDINGWQYKTETEFKDRLAYFLNHPELKRLLCAGAADSGRRFSVQAFAQNVEEVYQEQIALHRLIQKEVMV